MGAVTRPRKLQSPRLVESQVRERDPRARRDEAPQLPLDYRLLRAAQQGDAQSLAELVELHQRAVYGFLAARLLQKADADDLVQEVFLRCFSGKAVLDDVAPVRPWLIGVARNVLREHIRKLDRRREVAWTELCLEVETMVASDAGMYDDALDHLPECIESLGPSARQSLEMHYGQRLLLSEIGDRLRRSVGAVKLLLYRSRQTLRRCLDRKIASES